MVQNQFRTLLFGVQDNLYSFNYTEYNAIAKDFVEYRVLGSRGTVILIIILINGGRTYFVWRYRHYVSPLGRRLTWFKNWGNSFLSKYKLMSTTRWESGRLHSPETQPCSPAIGRFDSQPGGFTNIYDEPVIIIFRHSWFIPVEAGPSIERKHHISVELLKLRNEVGWKIVQLLAIAID